MSDLTFNVPAGESLRLMTAGKYCDRNITVKAGGGGGGADLETVIVNVTLWSGNMAMIYMTPSGVQTVENPSGYYEVVKGSPLSFVYDKDNGTAVVCTGSGFANHYTRNWPQDGHSCHVVSFYEDGSITLEEK